MRQRPIHLVLVVMCLCGAALRADDAAVKPETGSPKPEGGTTAIAPAPPDSPFAEAAAYAQPRCVKIYGAAIGREHGYATGIIVSPDGRILTAEGIYLAGDRIRVVTSDGQLHFALVERRSKELQVALLRISEPTPFYFEVPAESIVEPGDWAVAVSNCFKVADGTEDLSVNLGVVSLRGALDTRRRAVDFDVAGEILLIDAITSNPGAPGGALMTYDGRLAGMIGKLLESESTGTRLNYAIPCDLLRRFIDGKSVIDEPIVKPDDIDQPTGKPYVGIRLFRMAGKKSPAYIDRIAADSPAAKAGLKKDDLVLALDDQIVRSVEHYDQLAAKLKPGQAIMLMIKRKQDVLQAHITVGTATEDE